MVCENEGEGTNQGGSELIPLKDDESADKIRHVLLIQEAQPYRWKMFSHISHWNTEIVKPLNFVLYVLPSVNHPIIFQFIKGKFMALVVTKLPV